MSILTQDEFKILSGDFVLDSVLEFKDNKIFLFAQPEIIEISNEFENLEILKKLPTCLDNSRIRDRILIYLLLTLFLNLIGFVIALLMSHNDFTSIKIVEYTIKLKDMRSFTARSSYPAFTSIQSILNLPILPQDIVRG
jgi:predicted membrane metal-binding protein